MKVYFETKESSDPILVVAGGETVIPQIGWLITIDEKVFRVSDVCLSYEIKKDKEPFATVTIKKV